MMKELILSAFLLLTQVCYGAAQTSSYFNDIYFDAVVGCGDAFVGGITEDVNGNVIQAGMFSCTITANGQTVNSLGSYDAYLVKYSPIGDLAWVRVVQTGGWEQWLDVTTDLNGNVYAVGWTDSNQGADVQINYGHDGIFVKYDANGNRIFLNNEFSAAYAGGQYDRLTAITFSNNFLYLALAVAGNSIIFQTDLNGAVQWNYVYSVLNENDGNYYWTRPRIVVDPLYQTVYLVGGTSGQHSTVVANGKTVPGFSANNYDGFIFGLSTTGYPQWLAPQTTSGNDFTASVATDSQGNVYAVGCANGVLDGQPYSGGNCNPFITKYNWQGTRQWTRTLSTYSSEYANGVVADNLGGVYIRITPWNNWNTNTLVKFDSNGNVLWSVTMPANSANEDQSLPGIGWFFGANNILLDSSGAMTLAGVITYNQQAKGYVVAHNTPYTYKIQMNYTCGCNQFNTVLSNLQSLLNIVAQ